jgi:hypothetical protein
MHSLERRNYISALRPAVPSESRLLYSGNEREPVRDHSRESGSG